MSTQGDMPPQLRTTDLNFTIINANSFYYVLYHLLYESLLQGYEQTRITIYRTSAIFCLARYILLIIIGLLIFEQLKINTKHLANSTHLL